MRVTSGALVLLRTLPHACCCLHTRAQAGHDAIRSTAAAASPAGSVAHAPIVSAALAAGAGSAAILRLHEAADGPEARTRLAAAASSGAVASICEQLQPLWGRTLPFVVAACAPSGSGGGAEDHGFLTAEALRILWMTVLGCASAHAVVAPGGGGGLADFLRFLVPIIQRGGGALASAVPVAWALSLRLSFEGAGGAGAFCADAAAGGALAAICDASLAMAPPSEVRRVCLPLNPALQQQPAPCYSVQVPRAVALLEAAVAIAAAGGGSGSVLLGQLQVRVMACRGWLQGAARHPRSSASPPIVLPCPRSPPSRVSASALSRGTCAGGAAAMTTTTRRMQDL